LAHAWGLSGHEVVSRESKARVRLMEVLALHKEQEGREVGPEELMRDVSRILGKEGRGEEGWTREEMARESGMAVGDFERVYFETFLKGAYSCFSARIDIGLEEESLALCMPCWPCLSNHPQSTPVELLLPYVKFWAKPCVGSDIISACSADPQSKPTDSTSSDAPDTSS
jgi:hypothetical protein